MQLGLALAGLFVLAFVPLFFAVAGLARATLFAERQAAARALGRVVAARVAEAQASRGDRDLQALMEAQLGGPGGIYAIAAYDDAGRPVSRVGQADAALPATVTPGREDVHRVETRHGPALSVQVPGTRGAVVAVMRTDDEVGKAGAFVRLVGLYVLLVAIALLVFVYFSLTRLVVQPLDALGRGARRVAEGGRRLELPDKGAAELLDLAASLADMTARLRAEEDAQRTRVGELLRLTTELQASQERLVASQASLVASERLASVGRLSAGLAHEVGNPLAAVIGLQELLIDGGLTPDEQQDFLQRMRKETERIHRIVRDLLDFARPAAVGGKRARPSEPGDVTRAVGEVVSLLAPQKTMRDVDLAIDLEEPMPLVALSHEHLVQVLLNLVTNAADATGEGGHVTLRARGDAGKVVIEVDDDGPGIDPAIADTLFEPFTTTKDVGKGTGLGLAVCRGLVDGAGGTITGASRTDAKGARFVVTLPEATPPSSIPEKRP